MITGSFTFGPTPFLRRSHDCRMPTAMSLFARCLRLPWLSHSRWWRTIFTSGCCRTSPTSRSRRSYARSYLTSSKGGSSVCNTNDTSSWLAGPTSPWPQTSSTKLRWISSQLIRRCSLSLSKQLNAFNVLRATTILTRSLVRRESNPMVSLMLTTTTSRI